MEIVRQISMHCIERSKLLQRVWNSCMNILDNTLENNQKERNELIQDYDREMNELRLSIKNL